MRLLNFLRQPIKNGKEVAELLNVIQKFKQLAIIKTPGHSKAATMEVKGKYLAHAAARPVLPFIPKGNGQSFHITKTLWLSEVTLSCVLSCKLEKHTQRGKNI